MPARQPSQRKRSKWTAAELKIAFSLRPLDALKKLPGRTLSAIHTVRCLRKRSGAKLKAYKPGRPKGEKQ